MIGDVAHKMIRYFASDLRRINHALKVYGFACCIGRKENLQKETLFIIDAAALLHDIGIVEAERKYNSSRGRYQELEGPGVAKELLDEFDVDQKTMERICFLIGHHHSYHKIDDIDFQILAEADFLVNIDEDEISREAIHTVRHKYFKTKTGIEMLESMYG